MRTCLPGEMRGDRCVDSSAGVLSLQVGKDLLSQFRDVDGLTTKRCSTYPTQSEQAVDELAHALRRHQGAVALEDHHPSGATRRRHVPR